LPKGVENFQIAAMLRYGNFIYAYRTWSQMTSADDLKHDLSHNYNRELEGGVSKFEARKDPILEIDRIEKEDTHYVGHVSPKKILAEASTATKLQKLVSERIEESRDGFSELDAVVAGMGDIPEKTIAEGVVAGFRRQQPGSGLREFLASLRDASEKLGELEKRVGQIRKRAEHNLETYLTWDHMDVYFATSMREQWEYQSLFEFVSSVVTSPGLAGLKLRYFDPTQSFTGNRVDKGLVEALMLKRAKCTVYSVQETDTIGKDSELAATLAQGKPVIAYVPHQNTEARVRELQDATADFLFGRIRFLASEKNPVFASEVLYRFNSEQLELNEARTSRLWSSIAPAPKAAEVLPTPKFAFADLCQAVAAAEKELLDDRYKMLTETHPLAIQVNINDGVANGVLVARDPEACAQLIKGVLTRTLQFDLEDNERDRMWYLRERETRSIFRVVTKNRKLTNCFWSFYLRSTLHSASGGMK